MKTKPFNASNHKPGDKLVCGGDPVTDLIVGDTLVAGVRVAGTGMRCISRWHCDNGEPVDECLLAPLETLLPDPAHGWVPLHNGEPEWFYASPNKETAAYYADQQRITGPVVRCFVECEPMTREEAIALFQKHAMTKAYPPTNEVVDAILEASQWHVRAEGE